METWHFIEQCSLLRVISSNKQRYMKDIPEAMIVVVGAVTMWKYSRFSFYTNHEWHPIPIWSHFSPAQPYGPAVSVMLSSAN